MPGLYVFACARLRSAATGLRFRIDDECRSDARGRRISPWSGGQVARAARDFAEESLRLHIDLHFLELEVAVAHQREYGARGRHALLHDVGRTLGLADGPRPGALVVFIADEAVEIAVFVVGTKYQLFAILADEVE